MSENKNAAMTLEETRQWIADTWKRCQDEAWRQPATKTVVYLTAGSYSLETLENLVKLLRRVANDD